jgi:hypothetical protein
LIYVSNFISIKAVVLINMEMIKKQIKFFFFSRAFRIVRNRGGGSTNNGSPTATTTTTSEDDSRSHPTTISSSPNVYSIHSLLNHSQYEYSTTKQRSSSSRTNGKRLFFCFIYSDIPLVLLSNDFLYSHWNRIMTFSCFRSTFFK